MENKIKKTKMSYEPEADVLRIEISKKPIDYAKEMGDIVIHFSKDGLPVYLEILRAKRFLNKPQRILDRTKAIEFAVTG